MKTGQSVRPVLNANKWSDQGFHSAAQPQAELAKSEIANGPKRPLATYKKFAQCLLVVVLTPDKDSNQAEQNHKQDRHQ